MYGQVLSWDPQNLLPDFLVRVEMILPAFPGQFVEFSVDLR